MKLVSDQVSEREVQVILRELSKVLKNGVKGDVVEFGCYVGTTGIHIQKLLEGSDKELHVYDSFEGLPDKAAEDTSPAGEHFKPGELHATKNELIKNFRHAGLKLPVIHKGWFSDLKPHNVPDTIAFAFLDGDYYHSILDPLKLIWPTLAKNSVIVIDDYQNEKLPGVKKALDVWGQHHTFRIKSEVSLAIINV